MENLILLESGSYQIQDMEGRSDHQEGPAEDLKVFWFSRYFHKIQILPEYKSVLESEKVKSGNEIVLLHCKLTAQAASQRILIIQL